MAVLANPSKQGARFSPDILEAIAELVGDLPRSSRVLDPFAGVGGVHALGFDSVGVELETEWATQHPRTIVANALALPFAPGTFDAVITSPAYGNRLADRDMRPSCAGTYAKWLGREASAG